MAERSSRTVAAFVMTSWSFPKTTTVTAVVRTARATVR